MAIARTKIVDPSIQGSGRIGNKMGTGLAILAQCGYNLHISMRYRNRLEIKPVDHHCNVFPIPRVWQTRRNQNPVLAG